MTNVEVAETIMTGSTADISHICQFAWFDWVMFRDNIPTFSEAKLILGRYFGPATDIGLTLTTKILKSNGQILYRSTPRHLTDHDHACPVHTANRKSFDDSIAERLGPTAQGTDFPAKDLNPEYKLFRDVGDANFDLDPDHKDLKVTPEVGNNYVGVDLLFHKG